jgi:hypothetical protein
MISHQTEVLYESAVPTGEPFAPVTVILAPPPASRLRAFATGASVTLLLATLAVLGTLLWVSYSRQMELKDQLSAADAARHAEVLAARRFVSSLESRLALQTAEMAALDTSRRALEEALTLQSQALVNATRNRTSAVPRPAATEPVATQTVAAETTVTAAPAAPGTVVEPGSPLEKAMLATNALRSASVEEPPTLDRIQEHIQSGDPAVVNNKEQAKKDREKTGLAKVFTHPIFIDSAVLGASLMVPPSLPLTLAQSRLGRTLTRRVLKETDTDKSVAGKVATDVGNMPITRKRSKK